MEIEIITQISQFVIVFAGICALSFGAMLFAYLLGQLMSVLFD